MTKTKNPRPISKLCWLSLGVAGMLVWGGCGQSSVRLSSAEKQAFEQATPQIKQVWERALAADKAGDYTNTVALLDSLAEMELSEAQKQALYKEREAFNQKLWKAAEKNDPAAVKAVQLSQKDRRGTLPTPSQ